ncbi:MAG: DUF222 domain-containing protein [Streptosporangiaceae bacterium]|nr:DUF222 domain-containing protein [Streptosporangiaceae bacterium]
MIRRAFAAAAMSYSKVRALTRIATPATEQDLASMAAGMTASQVERFARAYHQCKEREAEDRPGQRAPRKSLRWRFDEDTGGITFTVALPPEQGAVLLQALRAAAGDLEHPHDDEQEGHRDKPQPVTAGTRPEPFRIETTDLADALAEVAGAYLRGKIAAAGNADIYQVVIHTTPQALTTRPGEHPGPVPAGTTAPVPAGTPGVPAGTPMGHPAWPGRCHVEDGPAITPQAAQLIACEATASTMVHDPGSGEILSLGRRSRRPTPAIRRAVRERDRYRCTFPGCDSRRTDLHHITWWSRGGHTSAANLQLLCKAHHAIVHDKGYIITRRPGGYTFTRPDGLTLATPPALPQPAGGISQTHDAAITPDTISKPVYGERLDLHLAIWIALNNKHDRQPEHAAQTFH